MKTKRVLWRLPLFKCFVCCFLAGGVPVTGICADTSVMEVNQRQTVEGVVLDSNGEPVIGATVQRIGQTGGTVTDENGRFSLAFSDNVRRVRLKISYIGMVTQEVMAHVGSPLKVTMVEDVTTLSDVVVIGYGTEKKKNVAGAVSNVSGEELVKTSVESLQKALQGKVSGVQITTANGAPGGGVSVTIRGRSTFSGGTSPLYIVDGVQIVTGDQSTGIIKSTDVLSTLNPDEIESIDILKDGASASIYGAQAANGVVIITTKKGRLGKPQISVNLSGGMQQISHKLSLLNASQVAELDLLAWKNRYGENSSEYLGRLEQNQGYGWGDDGYSLAPTTNWYDVIYRTAYTSNVQVSANGGTEKTKYYLSAAYNKTDGIVKETGFKRGAFRVNLTQELTPWLSVTTNNNYSVMDQSQYSSVRSANPSRVAILVYPANSPYDENGDFVQNLPYGYYQHNSLQMLKLNEYRGRTDKLITANSLDFKILKGLTFKSSYNADLTTIDEHNFIDPRTREGSKENGSVTTVTSRIVNFQTEQVASYSNVFNEIHRLSAVAGFSYRHERYTSHGATGTGVSDPSLHLLGTTAVAKEVTGSFSEWKMASLFARVNYTLKDRYIFTGTIRRDGSSRFGENNKWGLFPSFSAAWRIIEEPFMTPVRSWMSDLKLRASYGVTGNSDIGDYTARRWYSSSGAYNDTPAIIPSRIGNPYLTWEKNHSRNVGLTIGLFQDRISLETDFYLNDTKDLLYDRTIPATTGFTVIPSNMGGVRNKGVDILLNTVNVKLRNFEWRSSLNLSFTKNEITELQDGLEVLGDYKVGEPISSLPTYQWAGVNSADGRPMYYDKDGYITYVPKVEDRVWIKPADPTFYGGFTNDFTWKGLTLSVFFQFQRGAVSLWSDKLVLTAYEGDTNLLSDMYYKHWSKPGDVTWVPKPSYQGSYPGNPRQISEYSTLCYEKTDFIKLKNISLSYDFPTQWVKKMGLSNLQLYVSAYNLWTSTTYPGHDPEFTGSDVGVYPQSRNYTVGLKLDF